MASFFRFVFSSFENFKTFVFFVYFVSNCVESRSDLLTFTAIKTSFYLYTITFSFAEGVSPYVTKMYTITTKISGFFYFSFEKIGFLLVLNDV